MCGDGTRLRTAFLNRETDMTENFTFQQTTYAGGKQMYLSVYHKIVAIGDKTRMTHLTKKGARVVLNTEMKNRVLDMEFIDLCVC